MNETPFKTPEVGLEPIPGYALSERLGRGGFGEVWRAYAPGGFQVALKFVALGDACGPVELRALDIIRNIRHPNLLVTFAAWQVEGWLIIGMELADKTLMDRYREVTKKGLPGIPRDELWDYFQEAARGIDFLNEPREGPREGDGRQAIQHRDIKPQNILLVGNGVKVADFGLARIMNKSETLHSGGMTPAYAAPEFFQGHTHKTSDQYCLAVTYCKMRGGRLPYEGVLTEIMAGHLSGKPDLSMIPGLGEKAVVRRALSKKPMNRWPSCRAFVEALMACDNTPSVPGSPIGSHSAATKPYAEVGGVGGAVGGAVGGDAGGAGAAANAFSEFRTNPDAAPYTPPPARQPDLATKPPAEAAADALSAEALAARELLRGSESSRPPSNTAEAAAPVAPNRRPPPKPPRADAPLPDRPSKKKSSGRREKGGSPSLPTPPPVFPLIPPDSSVPMALRTWLVGRSNACDVSVDDSAVSSRHCRLTEIPNGFLLEDLGSRNGTFVNGVRIENPVTIRIQDEVTLGQTVLMPWPRELSTSTDTPRPASTYAPGKAPTGAPAEGERSIVGGPSNAKGFEVSIGRDAANDIVLDSPSVSNRHGRITLRGGQATIEDLTSTNGIAINRPANQIQKAPLLAGDVIYFGSLAVPAAQLLRAAAAKSGDHVLITFRGQSMVFGRDAGCDRILDLPTISGSHARIWREGPQLMIQDLGSTNGTFVNGDRIHKPTAVKANDLIGFGSQTFLLDVPTG